MSSPSPAAAPAPADALKPSAFEAFLDKNFRTICYAVLVAIVAVAIYSILRHRAYEADVEAATAATAAKTVDDCDIVIQKYKGSTAAGNALLSKAKLLWEQNKKDSAVAALREFAASYKDHPFYVQGLLGLATRLSAMGANEAKEADDLLNQIVRDHKTSEVAGLAQMHIADHLWAQGKQDEAKKLYEEMPRLFPGQFFDDNQKRLDWLAAALPTKEVAAPKVPEALKAPAPGAAPAAAPGLPNIVPPINLKSGGATMPIEIKPGAVSVGQPEVKITPPNPNAKINAEPVKLPTPTATSPVIEVKLPPEAPKTEPASSPAPSTPPAPAAPAAPAPAPKP